MFGWFDPVKKLEQRYRAELEAAEKELARAGDRARHAQLMAKAEATGKELDAMRAQQPG